MMLSIENIVLYKVYSLLLYNIILMLCYVIMLCTSILYLSDSKEDLFTCNGFELIKNV